MLKNSVVNKTVIFFFYFGSELLGTLGDGLFYFSQYFFRVGKHLVFGNNKSLTLEDALI